ncbi:GNAT family N-acetyltransferase [Pseudoalteromonas sp. OOF1S-7]|uniref:GNAT family N-acetyltransferase n=1 Tax=Pseudoalteromonas sp. OOF1S-7 TaxID=2917757 RepID=UPI001EF6C8DD|nr:GNAT family N-acetyltransferase [Pseudoalteromonas sp. OOF1S-7]MCG7533699.1 GNAT family N-acetyltransferase [Pseudoalteromonas sp. OOF1S-7]
MQVKTFYQLSHDELFQIFQTRVAVFVVEQACAYQEVDEIDKEADTLHVFSRQQGQLQAYARCYKPDSASCAIGRVLVSADCRGKGVAQTLMSSAIETCRSHYGQLPVKIAAQTYLTQFYQSFGFEPSGEAYLEDGIEHIDMILP